MRNIIAFLALAFAFAATCLSLEAQDFNARSNSAGNEPRELGENEFVTFTLPITDEILKSLAAGEELESVIPPHLIGHISKIKLEPRLSRTGPGSSTGGTASPQSGSRTNSLGMSYEDRFGNDRTENGSSRIAAQESSRIPTFRSSNNSDVTSTNNGQTSGRAPFGERIPSALESSSRQANNQNSGLTQRAPVFGPEPPPQNSFRTARQPNIRTADTSGFLREQNRSGTQSLPQSQRSPAVDSSRFIPVTPRQTNRPNNGLPARSSNALERSTNFQTPSSDIRTNSTDSGAVPAYRSDRRSVNADNQAYAGNQAYLSQPQIPGDLPGQYNANRYAQTQPYLNGPGYNHPDSRMNGVPEQRFNSQLADDRWADGTADYRNRPVSRMPSEYSRQHSGPYRYTNGPTQPVEYPYPPRMAYNQGSELPVPNFASSQNPRNLYQPVPSANNRLPTAKIPGETGNGDQSKEDRESGAVNGNAVAQQGKYYPTLYFLLLCSFGLNIYLAFISRGFYVRYRELADELRETFSTV